MFSFELMKSFLCHSNQKHYSLCNIQNKFLASFANCKIVENKENLDACGCVSSGQEIFMYAEANIQFGVIYGHLAHMATCLDFPIIPSQSFLSSLICLLSFLFCMRTCRNRFIHLHAEVILFPVLTSNLYFLLLISMFLSFEAVGYQQVFR